MAVDEILVNGTIEPIKSLTRIIVALGGVIFLYLVFNVINFFINRKKVKEIKKISQDLEDIKKLLSKKKRKG